MAGQAARMVAPSMQGRAIAVAMLGAPLASSLGIPAGTLLGNGVGWRPAFLIMSVLSVLLLSWVRWQVPDFPGQEAGRQQSVRRVFLLPGVRPVLAVMLAFVLAHNILYTYIAPFLAHVGLGARVDVVLLVFGAASLAGCMGDQPSRRRCGNGINAGPVSSPEWHHCGRVMQSSHLSLRQVLVCGAAVVTLSMGIRHGFGLWLQPITQAQGWTRETFAFALAIQNLAWGCFGIFAGMVADRFGAFRVLVGGAVLYGLGLAGMALATSPLVFALTAGVLIGAAQAGTTYAIVYGIIGRQIDPAKRSWAMGVAAAAGSFGQFLMVPVEGLLISAWAGSRRCWCWRPWCCWSRRWPWACASRASRRQAAAARADHRPGAARSHQATPASSC
jgi:MFS family permease